LFFFIKHVNFLILLLLYKDDNMSNENKLTFPALFQESVRKYGDAGFLSFVGETPITYSAAHDKVNELMDLFRKQGVARGDKIAILGANMPNWGISYLAITSLGAVVVPLLPDFSRVEVNNILEHCGAKGIVVSEKQQEKIAAPDYRGIRFVVGMEELAIVKADDCEPLEYEARVEEDDLAAIIYTSGTTGKSKGVMLTHKNICFNAIKGRELQPLSVGDKMLSILPLSHTYENTLGFILPMIGGACVYYLRQVPSPAVLLPAMQEVRPTAMLSVPLIIEKIFRLRVLPKFTKSPFMRTLYGVPAIRKVLHRAAGRKLKKSFGGKLIFFGIGGAKLDKTVEEFLREAGFPYAIGYGLTETSPLLAGANAKNTRLQSTGPAITGIELNIHDPDPVTGEGEIWARGPVIMKGYYNEPELTAEVMTPDGWFKTGDLGVMDQNGYFYIKGRLKNMILGASGENIYPEEIESLINNFRFVLESVVIQQKGKLVALVHFNREEIEKRYHNFKDEITDHIEAKLDELQKELHVYVNARVSKFAQLKAIVIHAEPFEKTATQKIKRFIYG
jgi:long-chain acyl-CoA synthetase